MLPLPPRRCAFPCCCRLPSSEWDRRHSGRRLRPSLTSQNVLTAEAVLGVRGAVRELRCQERMPELGSPPSAASIPASGRRGGAGLSAGPPAVVRGEEEPGGCSGRREENHASRKGYPCRLILPPEHSARTSPHRSRLLLSAQHSLISACRPLRVSMQNWVKTHSASSDATALA